MKIWFFVLLILLLGPAAIAEESVVGSVKSLSGNATVRRNGLTHQLSPGLPIYESDLIETGLDGQLGITFRDDTRIAIGPGSRLAVSRYAFKPAEKQHGFVIQLLRGTLEYISGLTAKLSPNSISIDTPTSTIAVRGTRVLVRAE